MDFTNTCKSVGENNLAASYLAGELGPAQAEAFEEHYLGCERCWSDVRAASELRAALGVAAVVPLRNRPDWPTWSLVAAAALTAVTVLGSWKLSQEGSLSPASPILRGRRADSLSVTAKALPGGRIEIVWTPHDDAQNYSVEVLRSDRVTVWKCETSRTRLTVETSSLRAGTGESIVARVQALDPLGEVVATGTTAPLLGH